MPFGNSLTREVSFKVGPVILDVLVKHYFDRLKRDVAGSDSPLKQDDILYHEAFTIVKSFLNASTFHTIEELQAFSNTRTPSPPWTHVVRTIVPISSCDEAATYLIKALGGEDVARKLVGGVKWWQVRGINGVDAQWISAKKDWREAKRRHKMHREQNSTDLPSPPSTEHDGGKPEAVYEKDMDAMRCILYLHGGGYYFGSVDQERYSIQRHARKINGRVFAINYRLAPQYPFPCGLQDAIAAYIYLIRPPPGSAHQPVDPGHIVIAGDSAGGGLSLALLQVIRDSGLPAPAGGVLISPWCDLTHSFASVHANTDSDVIPESGLSFHKPSLLWPPPSEEISSRVHASLRFRIRQAFRSEEPQQFTQTSTYMEPHQNGPNLPDHLATPIATPIDSEKVMVSIASGEVIEVNQQLHFYTRNSLLGHPLVSPAMSYLGGLPPLLIIAGDKEVLRDEIIYSAHKAAYPEKYSISSQTRELYPSLNGIEDRCKPTSVHLQVYDESPHILPVLFSFTTPAKFCFRGIASFCKFVTDMTKPPLVSRKTSNGNVARQQSLFSGFRPSPARRDTISTPKVTGEEADVILTESPTAEPKIDLNRPSIRRTMSLGLSRAGSDKEQPREQPESKPSDPASTDVPSVSSSDVGGPRFGTSVPEATEERTAGDPSVYQDIKDRRSWECRMIRERVSTSGVIRPLQPEDELDAFKVPCELVGQFSELTIQRYCRDRMRFDKKFAHRSKSIEKHRRRNLERAKEETIKRMSILRQTLQRVGGEPTPDKAHPVKTGMTESPGWGWAWALDEKEYPPPSSIVSRRDTEEARKLAEVADQAILGDDHMFSANNLWGVVLDFLTATPGKSRHALHKSDVDSTDTNTKTDENAKVKRHNSKLSRLWHGHRNPSKERPE